MIQFIKLTSALPEGGMVLVDARFIQAICPTANGSIVCAPVHVHGGFVVKESVQRVLDLIQAAGVELDVTDDAPTTF